MKLVIRLPVNRWQEGEGTLLGDDGNELGRWPCRGKADNGKAAANGNPPAGEPSQRDPRKPFGDTPAGAWQGCRAVIRPRHEPGDHIGPTWIPLPHERAADDATRELLDPARQGCREDLGIHAGRGDGELIATNGCVRMRDRDFARLVELVGEKKFGVEIQDIESTEMSKI